MEDAKIIALYWERQERAIEETAAKYGVYCYSISYGILRNKEDADECVSDTWLKAWNAMPPQRPSALQAFLAKITRHLSLARSRRRSALFRGRGQVTVALEELEYAAPSAPSAEEAASELELIAGLERFLWDLPLEKRQVFLLRYWYFYSDREIAQQMHMSKGKVTSMLFRLRCGLKEFLQKEGIWL